MSVKTFVIIILSLASVKNVLSLVSCNSTDDCKRNLITPGVSVCENGKCTNPFEQGCLKAMGDKYGEKNFTRIKTSFDEIRICNSDDYRKGDTSRCKIPDWKEFFEMGEIRIANSPWSSAFVFSWMIQIILTELLEVPATIENGVDREKGFASFYDRQEVSLFSPLYGENKTELDALIEASRVGGNCELTDNPCAHVIPDASPFDR